MSSVSQPPDPERKPGWGLLAGRLLAIAPGEGAAVCLAAACNFSLMASYYLLRPLRDSAATVGGAEQLPRLYTGTFLIMLVCAPLFAALAARVRLVRLVPALFWFWLANILGFWWLFPRQGPGGTLAAAYFWWFSVTNLYMISVFWSLLADRFTTQQATRVFALIAGAGSLGAIVGPILMRVLVVERGARDMLLVAAAGFLVTIGLLHAFMRAARRLPADGLEGARPGLDHTLPGNPFAGFTTVMRTPMLRWQALFMLLMTWVATVAYYFQTEFVQHAFGGYAERTRALADIDLWVNSVSALVAIAGTGPVVRRFGVTAGLMLNPLLLIGALAGLAIAPGVRAIQLLQVVRRAGQYAIARPCREICFTVVPQDSRYKAKAVIDTAVYRLGDLTAIWVQAAIRAASGSARIAIAIGVVISALWALVGLVLGRRYEALRAAGGAEGGSGLVRPQPGPQTGGDRNLEQGAA